jgi:tetratricopeptide (TPR) repeat protein
MLSSITTGEMHMLENANMTRQSRISTRLLRSIQSLLRLIENGGLAYFGKGQFDQWILDSNKADEVDPKAASIFTDRGKFCVGKYQYDESISNSIRPLRSTQSLLKRTPNADGLISKKGHYDQAISDFNKALEINSWFAVAYNNRRIAYYFKKEYDKSWEDIKRAQDLGYQIPAEFLDDLRKASGRQN